MRHLLVVSFVLWAGPASAELVVIRTDKGDVVVEIEGVRLMVDGPVHDHNVRRIVEVIESEVAAGTYVPTVDPETLGYAIVRLAEAFLLHDIRGDVERLRTLEAALLGVGP